MTTAIDKIKEIRVLTMEKLRMLCVNKGYYTEGTVEDYEKLLLFVKDSEMTTENIYKVAVDIINHSNVAPYYKQEGYNDMLTNIMYNIADACYTYFNIQ